MIEVRGNLWTYPNADVRVITTNGTVKKDGTCVMGRGCALEAKQRYPEMPLKLGRKIREQGNRVFLLLDDPVILSFPVKHHWFERADINLIHDSANMLRLGVDYHPGVRVVVMPRPGCGNGGLRWEDVKPILAPILDDRFHVITF